MNIKKIILSLFISGTSAVSYAQESFSFSLQEAQDYAIKHNYQNQNAIKDIEIAKKKVWETTAIGLPQVNAEGQIQRFIDIPTQVAPANAFNPLAPEGQLATFQFGLNYNNSVGISASQLIFDGSYIVGLQAAKTYKELSINSQAKTEIELKDAVAQAYYTVLATEKNVVVLKNSLEATQKMLTETQALYREGLTEEQNVDQLELNVNALQTNFEIAEDQRDFAKKLLNIQLGLPIETQVTLTEQLDNLVTTNQNSLADKKFSAENHIDYELTVTNMKLSQLNLRKEKYSFLPTLSAFFSHQQQNFGNELDVFSGDARWFPATIVGLNLKLPILTSGARLSKVSQAKIEFEKMENTAKEVEQNLKYQAELAASNFDTAKETFDNQKDNLALAQKIYDKTVKKYDAGIASSLELTQAQNQLLSAEGNYIKAVLDLLNARSALEKSYGQK
ncbi:MAG TPA: TolC family protein [Vicingaceae bacterium]|nr:TolC family protein [Vicingaceae bacterium]